jgi:hypothetical protein
MSFCCLTVSLSSFWAPSHRFKVWEMKRHINVYSSIQWEKLPIIHITIPCVFVIVNIAFNRIVCAPWRRGIKEIWFPNFLKAPLILCQSQSQSHVTTDDQSVCRGVKFTLELVTRYCFLSESWKLLCCLCGAPSLTRGRVCLLDSLISRCVEMFSVSYYRLWVLLKKESSKFLQTN